jgi:hypothetical protein
VLVAMQEHALNEEEDQALAEMGALFIVYIVLV